MISSNFKGFEKGFTLVELSVTTAMATRYLLMRSIHVAKQQTTSKRVNAYFYSTVNGWDTAYCLAYKDCNGSSMFTSCDLIICNISSKIQNTTTTYLPLFFLLLAIQVAITLRFSLI